MHRLKTVAIILQEGEKHTNKKNGEPKMDIRMQILFTALFLKKQNINLRISNKSFKQAGAELCQAQFKLV